MRRLSQSGASRRNGPGGRELRAPIPESSPPGPSCASLAVRELQQPPIHPHRLATGAQPLGPAHNPKLPAAPTVFGTLQYKVIDSKGNINIKNLGPTFDPSTKHFETRINRFLFNNLRKTIRRASRKTPIPRVFLPMAYTDSRRKPIANQS